MATDNYDRAIGEIFADLRRSHGLTQGEVADAVGVSVATLSLYERGESRCPTSTFMRISLKVFGEHPSEVMRRVEHCLLGEADELTY